jgi:hypothetical protein
MAKKNDKRLGEDPFERFLPQIQDSRKKKDDDVSSDISKNVDDDVNKVKNDDVDKINDVDVNVNDDVANIVNNDVNISTVKNNVGDSAVNSDAAASTKGTITIARKKFKSDDYTRATYYLRPDQIRTLNRLHKDSGRDKSELVRMAVDILIERAKVE